MDSTRVRASYDAVAVRYAEEIGGELTGKPVDRALLECLVELAGRAGRAVIADVGCGPGHVSGYLAALGADVLGVDLTPGMIRVARKRHPDLAFVVASMLALPVPDGALAAAVCPYSIIHFDRDQRLAAFVELARAIVGGGWLLVAFHVSMPGRPPGSTERATLWWGHQVELDFHFLDPAAVIGDLRAAGFDLMARTDRQPWPAVEQPSQRCYLLARRRALPG